MLIGFLLVNSMYNPKVGKIQTPNSTRYKKHVENTYKHTNTNEVTIHLLTYTTPNTKEIQLT